MRGLAAAALALTLVCSALPAIAQSRDAKPGTEGTPAADRSTVGTRSVTGTVKMMKDNGFVVVGRETGQRPTDQKDREWAFVFDGDSRVIADGKARAARELREGEPVTVTYTNRDGRIVARSVTVNRK
jgi:hypothetical protein